MGGDVPNHNIWKLNRILTTVTCTLFLISLVGVPLYFYYRVQNQSAHKPCHEHLSVPLLNPIFLQNGSIVDGDQLYPSGYYYKSDGILRGCLCDLIPCIRKCCGRDEYLVKAPRSLATCEKIHGISPFHNFSLPVHKSPGEPVEVDRDHFRILYGSVCKHGRFILDPEAYPNERYDLMIDGRLRNVDGEHFDVTNYCMDSMNGIEKIRTFICFADPEVDVETKLQYLLYPIAMIISLPFLVGTILVYSILPSLRSLHGKSLVCQCFSLLVTYIGFATIQLKSNDISDFWCVFLAFMVQCSGLASFFWLNVISFDIWWSFSGLRPLRWGLKITEHKRFLLYSLYAWGIPLIIVATSIAIDSIPSIPDTFIKPQIGKQKCWFAEWQATFLYFYLPSGIVLSSNIVMFIATAIKIRSYTKDDHEKDRFRLYLRLFIVMGLSWIMELVSFFVGGPKSIWFVIDISNSLQGVVIFYFFVCKREILRKLNKKLCPSWNLFRGTSQELSKSPSSSASLAKTENNVLPLKILDESDNNKNDEIQSQVA